MAGNEVQIILTAVDKASAALKKTADSTSMLGKAADKLGISTGALVGGFTAVVGGAMMVGKELGKIVNSTVEYGKQVDDLSRALGINAEESSKLIQIADDLRIDMGTLKMGFKKALMEGVTPNIEGIKGLAKEYQALESPVEKAQFAMKYFGRAGLELNKILELTPDQLDEMAESAERAGLVMSGEGVQATKDYYLALDQMNDSVEGVKLQIGTGLIPALSKLATAVNDGLTDAQNQKAAIEDVKAAYEAGLITYAEMVKMNIAIQRGTEDVIAIEKLATTTEMLLNDGRREGIITLQGVKTSTEEVTEATITYDDVTEAAKAEVWMYNDALLAARGAQDELALATETGRQVADLALQKINELNISEGIRLQLEKDIAIATGVMTEKDVALEEAVGYLTAQLALGNISLSEYLGYLEDISAEGADVNSILTTIGTTIENLPTEKDFAYNITVTTKYKGKPYKVSEPGGESPVIYEDEGEGEYGGKKQFGGPVMAGQAYVVGEGGPELFVPMRSGRIINNWNLTINEAGQRGNVVQDFELMKALARA